MSLNAIGIISQNIPESVRFYSLLGLNFEPCDKTTQHLESSLPNGLRLMLDSEELIRSLKPHWIKPKYSSISLAFEYKSAEEVDQAYTKFITAGFNAEKEPWDAFWGQRYATVLDPDGNSIDLFAAL